MGVNGGKGAGEGQKSTGNVGKVGGVRQNVGKFTDEQVKTPRRREQFL